MKANPLRNGSQEANHIRPPSDPEQRRAFWIERGNRVLWGEEATTKGEFLNPRRDLQWAWSNGSYYLEPRQPKRIGYVA